MNESKEKIIKAALFLFLHNSYADVSIRNILINAGVSRGAFYHYFVSKEACFEECVKYYIAMATQPEPSDYADVSLKAFIEDNIRRMSRMTNMPSLPEKLLFLSEAVKIIPDFVGYMEQRNANEITTWEKVIENAIDAGEIRDSIPADELAVLFIAQCDGIMIMRGMTMEHKDGCAEVEKQWSNLYSLLKV